MKIKQTLPNLHLICSKDNLRPQLGYVEFDFAKRTMSATDAHVALIVDMNQYFEEIEPQDIGTIYVHMNDYKFMCKKDVEYIHLNMKDNSFLCEGKTKTLAGFKTELDTKFPNIEVVIPTEEMRAIGDVRFGLNIGVLTSLVSVFDKYKKIIMTPTRPHRAIRVDIQTAGGSYSQTDSHKLAYGCIMPVIID